MSENFDELDQFQSESINKEAVMDYIRKLKRGLYLAQLTSQQLATRCGNYSQDTSKKHEASARAMAEAKNFAIRQLNRPTTQYAQMVVSNLAEMYSEGYTLEVELSKSAGDQNEF